MKTTFLFILLLLTVSTLVSAQRQLRFGLSVQSGNYLQARQEQRNYPYQTTEHRLHAGVLFGLGVYAERNLGQHFTLVSGLNYFQSAFNERITTVYSGPLAFPFGEKIDKKEGTSVVRQLALPVQLQLRTGKRRLDFSVGVAPALTAIKSGLYFPPLYFDYVCTYCDYAYTDAEPFETRFQMLFTVGLHYRPDTHNAIGLEFWLAPKAKETDDYSNGFDPLYYYNFPDQPYRMRSLQLALRHNW